MTDYTKEKIQKTANLRHHIPPRCRKKTTLTEKFLLYGGAINLAGSVKGKATARHASIRLDGNRKRTRNLRNILRTPVQLRWLLHQHPGHPGHQDFSEDTYRTLMAADSAVMVIDASKGVEAQTRKLFKVCAMRPHPDLYIYQ